MRKSLPAPGKMAVIVWEWTRDAPIGYYSRYKHDSVAYRLARLEFACWLRFRAVSVRLK